MRKIIFVIICVLVFVSLYIKFIVPKKEVKEIEGPKDINEKEKLNDNSIEKVDFNEKEQKIVDAIYKKFDNSYYFDNSNLKLFEILKVQLYGYYASKSNILYIRVEYKSECKDGTYDCDNLALDKKYSLSNNEPFYFFIKIDINSYNYIEKIDGISSSMNSDWVQDYKRIE